MSFGMISLFWLRCDKIVYGGLLLPISAPSVYGVSFLKMIELVGLFPWNT